MIRITIQGWNEANTHTQTHTIQSQSVCVCLKNEMSCQYVIFRCSAEEATEEWKHIKPSDTNTHTNTEKPFTLNKYSFSSVKLNTAPCWWDFATAQILNQTQSCSVVFILISTSEGRKINCFTLFLLLSNLLQTCRNIRLKDRNLTLVAWMPHLVKILT